MPLSIVIPSHNRADLLADCLGSIRRHAPPETQILVVDDASPGDRVAEVARAFDVEVLSLRWRSGFCVAANAGIAQARGDIVQVLNDDTEVSRGWASAALARFTDPTICAVTPLVLHGPPGAHPVERIDSAGDSYSLGGVARKRWNGEVFSERHLSPGFVFGASGVGSFYRRETLLAVGGFPEEFVAYFDDVDLSFRLNRVGRIFYEPASRIHHRVSASYGRPSGDLLALQSRNEELVYWRNLPMMTLLVSLPLHAAVLVGKAMLRLREGRLGPFLRGRRQALALLPAVLRKRLKGR